MLLSLDLGNTSLKGVLWRGEERVQRFRLLHGDSLADDLRSSLDPVEECVGVASHGVLEAAPAALKGLTAVLPCAPRWVGRELAAPGRVAYDDASECGLDRCLAVWGLRDFARTGLVVDCGTAVTFTHLDEEGTIRGLAIGAGHRTLREGIGHAAPALAPFLGGEPPVGVPRGTADNLAVGVDIAWAGGLRALLRDARRRLGDAGVACGRVFVTGSDAARARAALRAGRIEPELVHRGLRRLARDEA